MTANIFPNPYLYLYRYQGILSEFPMALYTILLGAKADNVIPFFSGSCMNTVIISME